MLYILIMLKSLYFIVKIKMISCLLHVEIVLLESTQDIKPKQCDLDQCSINLYPAHLFGCFKRTVVKMHHFPIFIYGPSSTVTCSHDIRRFLPQTETSQYILRFPLLWEREYNWRYHSMEIFWSNEFSQQVSRTQANVRLS